MMKLEKGETLVIASHNQGKVVEIQELLEPYNIKCISAAELDLDEPEETGTTFHANAELKAVAAAKASGYKALADDSGFALRALGGDPGIYSARWAGPDKDFNLAMQKVQDQLEAHEDKAAAFICVLSLSDAQGNVVSFEGRVDGSMVWPPRGDKGFGYDPVFVAKGYTETFAEIDPHEKHSISHRANAFHKFIKDCFE